MTSQPSKAQALSAKIAPLTGPDSEYMSSAMIDIFREHLEAERATLQGEQEVALEFLRKADEDRPTDPLDVAQKQEDTEREHTRSAQRRELLKKTEAALRLIANGDYGFCVDCGSEVGLQRLIANPSSTRDINCAARHEQRAMIRTAGNVATLSLG